jgi:hypothetical protein
LSPGCADGSVINYSNLSTQIDKSVTQIPVRYVELNGNTLEKLVLYNMAEINKEFEGISTEIQRLKVRCHVLLFFP